MMTKPNAGQSLGLALVGFVLLGAPAARAEDNSVAIVEDTSGAVAGVEPLDLLRAGREIALNADAGLIISYLNSCQRESIRGGKVIIGKEKSEVKGGEITRRRIACDAAALALTPEQANQSATLVFRPAPIEEGVNFVAESRQPIVIAPDLEVVTIMDLRQGGATWSVTVVKGVADLTAKRKPLDQGGLYRLSGGGKSVTFRVGKEATDAPLPLLKRAIRL